MNKVYRNLEIIAPHLISEWDEDLNGDNLYTNFWNSREDPPHWICHKKHRWQMRWDARVDQGQNCPYCSGHRIIVGENDLSTRFPEISKDWNYELNELKPSDVKPYSHTKVWWNCSNDLHEPYLQIISKRTSRGTSCPECSKGRGSSKGEYELGEFLKSLNINFIQNSRKVIKPMELDFYIPGQQLAIEYNGEWMHSNRALKDDSKDKTFRDYHLRKMGLANQIGLDLFFVWEHDWLEHRGEVLKALKEVLLSGKDQRKISKILLRLESFKDIAKDCCEARV